MLHLTLQPAAVLADTGSKRGGGLASLLPLLVIGLLFYVAIIRPQRKRAAKARSAVDALTPGRRVMTTAGLVATVVAVEDAEVELEIAPGVRTRWAKGAVARVLDEPPAVGETGQFPVPS